MANERGNPPRESLAGLTIGDETAIHFQLQAIRNQVEMKQLNKVLKTCCRARDEVYVLATTHRTMSRSRSPAFIGGRFCF